MYRKRKDAKGRLLKVGESQRKDSIYQYRYTDARGKRRTIYSSDLKELREKEAEIQRQLCDGYDYAAGDIPVHELVERYISLRQGARYSTKSRNNYVLRMVKNEDFGYRRIRDVRMSDAQMWLIKLNEGGKGYSTLASVRSVLKLAFQMACNEAVIRSNPFDFRLSDVIPDDSKSRDALTQAQQDALMRFVQEDPVCKKHYDEFVVLLGTGLRVSEFCGLTKADLDFENRKICVDHQLLRRTDGSYYIEKPKTERGRRFIPMSEDVFQSLKNILKNRPKLKTEVLVDGYSGFLLIGEKLRPKVSLNIQSAVRTARERYNKSHPDIPLPSITPHVFRHTFCTNMANAGMDISSLQYLMGHSNVNITLDVYTHSNFERAAEQMGRLFEFPGGSKKQQGRGPV